MGAAACGVSAAQALWKMRRPIGAATLAGVVIISMLAVAMGSDADAIVPETQVQVTMGAKPFAPTLSFLTVEETATCDISVNRCFSSSQYPHPDPCKECTDKCASLEEQAKVGACSPETVKVCKKNCDSKCTWAYETKSFESSYRTLCQSEIKHK